MTGDQILHGTLLLCGGAIWHFLKALFDKLAEKEVAFLGRFFKKKSAPPDDNFI